MIWWYWMLVGLVLLGAEMVTPGGFYILFFGLAALAVGTLAGAGLVQAEWLQWLLFSGLAVLSLLVFRGPLLAWIKAQEVETPAVDSMGGETAIPLEDLAPGGTGKAELRGTTWTAHNAGPALLKKSQRCKVERVEGLTLWITAE
ncbi:MAG: NfeD family protein [Nitrospirae bacterium]|nr:NfeD family protein [Nitrospirota bacterium]MDE3041490.1 NfeD family protein [Nitrospirota bacterium]MDE3049850.1 NfeD family protein [Nitrospirota bacterium]MDE3219460.1 NfeD family protein [Nitrospirota bacterium]